MYHVDIEDSVLALSSRFLNYTWELDTRTDLNELSTKSDGENNVNDNPVAAIAQSQSQPVVILEFEFQCNVSAR